jgi:hypothetical protein
MARRACRNGGSNRSQKLDIVFMHFRMATATTQSREITAGGWLAKISDDNDKHLNCLLGVPYGQSSIVSALVAH